MGEGGKKAGYPKVARMSRIIRQLQRDQKQSDPVFTTISRPLSKLPGRHPRELNFTERMCRSWMIGGWWRWWWRGRGWLDDTKMEWRDHGGRFRRDEMKLYTDRNNERCSNFPARNSCETRYGRIYLSCRIEKPRALFPNGNYRK